VSSFPERSVRDGRKILVLANCQVGGLTACLDMFLPRDSVTGFHWTFTDQGRADAAAAAADADLVVTSAPAELRAQMAAEHGFDEAKCLVVPSLHFTGFHPDLTIAYVDGKQINLLNGAPYQSAIGVWCWKRGMDIADTRRVFTGEAMKALGFDRHWPAAVAQARGFFAETTVSFSDFFLPLQASGRVFMHTCNHPSIAAIAQLARVIGRMVGAQEGDLRQPVEHMIPDALSLNSIWPIYPGVADSLGLSPSWLWKFENTYYDLDGYLDTQFRSLDAVDGSIVCLPSDDPQFAAALRTVVSR